LLINQIISDVELLLLEINEGRGALIASLLLIAVLYELVDCACKAKSTND
jgi:hypothetical protein